MRVLREATTALGILALLGTLALLSPGVSVVRADDDAPAAVSSESADGPTCEAGNASGEEEIVEYLEYVQRLQLEQMAASPGSEADGDFIVLNNRGYNYGPARVSLPSGLELESGN